MHLKDIRADPLGALLLDYQRELEVRGNQKTTTSKSRKAHVQPSHTNIFSKALWQNKSNGNSCYGRRQRHPILLSESR
ncbi:hypothetical protein TNCV_3715071 [Trichonephila clavipes]|nr:hypothetical protein TNCV_3715071 [Trichonephila clavipes]